jgi:hypothetical protein
MNKTTRDRLEHLEHLAQKLALHKTAIMTIREELLYLGIADDNLRRAVHALGEADTEIELALEETR